MPVNIRSNYLIISEISTIWSLVSSIDKIIFSLYYYYFICFNISLFARFLGHILSFISIQFFEIEIKWRFLGSKLLTPMQNCSIVVFKKIEYKTIKFVLSLFFSFEASHGTCLIFKNNFFAILFCLSHKHQLFEYKATKLFFIFCYFFCLWTQKSQLLVF